MKNGMKLKINVKAVSQHCFISFVHPLLSATSSTVTLCLITIFAIRKLPKYHLTHANHLKFVF